MHKSEFMITYEINNFLWSVYMRGYSKNSWKNVYYTKKAMHGFKNFSAPEETSLLIFHEQLEVHPYEVNI